MIWKKYMKQLNTILYGNRLHRLWHRICKILRDKHGDAEIPDAIIREVARCLLPEIIAFFESEEGRAEYAAWKASREQKEAGKAG